MRNIFSKKQHTDEDIIKLLDKGHLAHYERRFSDAITNLQQATDYIIEKQRLTNYLFDARLNLGVNYKRIGNVAKAYECYRSLIGMNLTLEDEYDLYNALGKVCYLLGYRQQAIESYIVTLRGSRGQDDNMLHHIGHAMLDLDTSQNFNTDMKIQVGEYRKMLMGEHHAYDIRMFPEYVNLARAALDI